MARHPEWLLTAERAALHRPTATAVIADLHLGYAQTRQRRGDAVPPVRVEDALAPLAKLAARERVARLIIAGDLFEAVVNETLIDELLRWLDDARIELGAVVPGNHDRSLRGRPRLPLCPDGIEVDGWRVLHGDGVLPEVALIQGHVHPCLRWRGGLRAPCFLQGERHIVLPAFSGDAAGVNVLGDPRWQNYRCHVIVSEREVLDFGEVSRLKRARPGPLPSG